MSNTTTNPFFSQDLPDFESFSAADIGTAVQSIVAEYQTVLNAIASHTGDQPWTWQTLMEPLIEVDVRLSRVWSLVSHLNAVRSNDAWRAAYMESLQTISVFCAELGQNQPLYQALLGLQQQPEYQQYSAAQQQAIVHRLRDAKLSGVGLPEGKRSDFIALQAKLSELSQTFENQVLDATDAWSLDLTAIDALAGLPATDIALAKAAAPTGVAYRITLKPNMVQAVLNYAKDRDLRRQVYHAWVTRASEVGPHAGQFDNSDVMVQLLQAKTTEAKMLGYQHYAAVSLVPKMANTPEQVIEFLTRLGRKALPYAREEKQQLQTFAAEHLGLDELAPWDIGFASEALQQHAYQVSSEEVRGYFSLERVVAGLFDLTQQLFGVKLTADPSIPVWHEQVTAYRVEAQAGQDIGVVYFDLFSREKKRGGAWMNNAQDRAKTSNSETQPWVFLTCNFAPPVANGPTLLTHDDVITLFHEFGHSLHCLLTQIDVYGVSGISGVPWDAVELPSQLLEHWCWQPEMLTKLTQHHETQQPMPEALQQKLIRTNHFQTGMSLLRQVQFALFDMRLHCQQDNFSIAMMDTLLAEIRADFSVFPAYPKQRFAHSFSHIFGGGYAAGYYSYLWAQVLASDVFAAFEEQGILNEQVGQHYLQTILSQGGSVDMQQAFRAFRGRDPDEAALFRHLGLS